MQRDEQVDQRRAAQRNVDVEDPAPAPLALAGPLPCPDPVPGLAVDSATRYSFFYPARLRAPFEALPSLVAPSSLLGPGSTGALWLAGASAVFPSASGVVDLPAGKSIC